MSGYIGVVPLPQATQTRDVFTATSGQTSFATSGYTPNFLDVWLNGVKLVNGDDFTAINGSDVVLTSGAAAGDTVEVLSYSTYEVNAQTYTGGLTVNNDAATVLTVDRATSDGTLVDFKKDGTSVGSVGNYYTSGILFDAPSTIRFSQSGGTGGNTRTLRFANFSGGTSGYFGPNNDANSDAGISLGTGDGRWQNLYLSGGVYLGGTGAANLLDDYEEGTWTPTFTNTGTATLQYARYVKIGNTVSFWVRVGFASGVSANSSYFSMPFASTTMSSGTWTRGTIEGGFVEPQVGTSCYFSSAPSGYSGLFIIAATYSTQ